MKANLLSGFLTACLIIACSLMARAETYRITDLGTLGTNSSFATGLNAAGQVSGYSATGTNTARAWRYSPGVGLVDLGSFGGADNRAMAINDAGLVTGYSTDSNGVTHGFISGGAGLTNIGGSGTTANILPQHINNAGRVAGFFLTAGDERPFLFSLPNTLSNLGTITGAPLPATAAAYCLNDLGVVVGIGTGSNNFNRAFRSTPAGSLEELGTLGGDESWAYAINNANQIIGSASFLSTDTHAFLFSEGKGMIDLGTLGGYTSAGFALDAAGNIVGTAERANRELRAVLWPIGERVRDLNDFVPVNAGWVLTDARGVNDAGQIVGNGLLHGQPRAFLLTPNSGADTNPPVARLAVNNITNIETGAKFFQLTFWDDTAVQESTITTNAIRVTGPNGFDQIATLYPYSPTSPYQLLDTNNAMAISANFYILPANKVWNGTNNGLYTVSIEPDTVSDTNGNVLPAGIIGTFTVATETKPVISMTAVSAPVMNQSASFALAGLSSFPYDSSDVFHFAIDWENDGSKVENIVATNGTLIAYTFTSIGSHTIRLTATDVHGSASDDYFTSVFVGNPPFPNTWTAAPALTGNRRLALGLNSGGTLLCFGGQPLRSSKLQSQLLAPGAAAFADGARVDAQTTGLGAGIDSLNRIIVFGGIEPNAAAANLNGYVYLPASGNGPAIASKHLATHDFAYCSDNRHRLYSISGAVGAGVTSGTAAMERYDASENSWTSLAPMPGARINATAAYDGQGHILVIGGIDPASGFLTVTTFSYDIATDTWSQLADAPLAGFTGRVAALGADGMVYLIGGINSGFVVSSQVDMFDPSLNEWFSGPHLTAGRGTPAVALGNDGFIYVMGGDETSNGGGNNNGQATVEKLDTATPHAPRIISTPNFGFSTVQAESVFFYQIMATGNPRPAYSIVQAPLGMTINTNTGFVQWTPATNQLGIQSITVRASSTAGVAEQVFAIAVTPLPGDVTAPTAPARISLVFRNATQVTLTWPAATDDVGVTSYNIYGLFRGSRSSRIGLMASGITNRSYIAQSGVSAYYVAAVDAAGNISPRSTPVSASVLTLPLISGPVTPPKIIQGNALLATISASANPSAGFSTFAGPSGMTFSHVSGPVTNADYVVVQWQPTAAQVGTNTFTVSATNANTTGSSATFTVIVLPNGTDFIPPTPVAQITASSISFDRCNLTWTAAGDNIGIATYHIVATHFAVPSNHVVTIDIPGTTTTAQLAGLLAASGYTVAITPVDTSGNTGGTTSIFLITLAEPNPNLQMSAGPLPDTMSLAWTSQGAQWKFTLESTDSLSTPNWTTVQPTNQWPSFATNLVISSAPPTPHRFYRLKTTPAQP